MTRAKVISISENIVSAEKQDGSFINIEMSSFLYSPQVGDYVKEVEDYVEVFKNEDGIREKNLNTLLYATKIAANVQLVLNAVVVGFFFIRPFLFGALESLDYIVSRGIAAVVVAAIILCLFFYIIMWAFSSLASVYIVVHINSITKLQFTKVSTASIVLGFLSSWFFCVGILLLIHRILSNRKSTVV